jgi:UDP-galactopyranose mutase
MTFRNDSIEFNQSVYSGAASLFSSYIVGKLAFSTVSFLHKDDIFCT